MSATRRAVSPLLTLQALVFVVLTLAVGALYSVERSTYRSEVEIPAREIRVVRAQAAQAVALPYAVAATRDSGLAQEARKAGLKAKDGLDRIKVDLGRLAGVNAAADDAQRALTAVDSVLTVIEAATEDTRLTNVYTELETQNARLNTSLDRLDTAVVASMAFHYDQNIQILLAIWAGALVISLVTGMSARSRAASNDAEADRQVGQAVESFGRVLRQALAGDEVQTGGLPTQGPFAGLSDPLRKLVSQLTDTIRANRAMARSNNFLHDLQDALSLAESEKDVLTTAIRAAKSAYRDNGFQLITVDPANQQIRLTDTDGPSLCSFRAPENCPAMSHGRTWNHIVDDALARCPRLNEDNVCVTCVPIQVDGRPMAVAQLSKYDPTSVRFEELEALALATAVRLSITRNMSARVVESETDPLTALANRRRYERRMAELDASNTPYTLVMADLDNFKALNDRYGHDIGDRSLEIFAEVLRDACRDSDLPCRVGGEEFVIILPGVGVKAGLAVSMRIRSYLADACSRAPATFTVSLGVAARPEHGNMAEAVLRAADAALYDAKEAGRDQVVPARMHTNLEAAR